MCIDDVTGKELPWHELREARGSELKYLRDLGVYEKVDDREGAAQITPVDTKWNDSNTTFEEEPMQIRSRKVARELNSERRPDLFRSHLGSRTSSDGGHCNTWFVFSSLSP